MGQEKGEKFMSYLNSVTIIGFVGADPEQRQARNNNGSKFTVLSVATQRSWKNTDDEWASKTEWHRVCVFRPRLAEYVATTIKKGSHLCAEDSPIAPPNAGFRIHKRLPHPTFFSVLLGLSPRILWRNMTKT
jgi:hypothetical protein